MKVENVVDDTSLIKIWKSFFQNFTGKQKDVPYFILLFGGSLLDFNCFRPQLLPATIPGSGQCVHGFCDVYFAISYSVWLPAFTDTGTGLITCIQDTVEGAGSVITPECCNNFVGKWLQEWVDVCWHVSCPSPHPRTAFWLYETACLVSSPQHLWLRTLAVPHHPTIHTRPSIFSTKGSRVISYEIFTLVGALVLVLLLILSSFFWM